MKVHAELVVLMVVTTLGATALVDAQNPAAGANRAHPRTTSIAGRIVHPDGAAAEGARVAVYAVVEEAPGAVVATALSGHDGRYEVTGLPAGTFMIGVTPLKGGGFGGEVKRPATPPVETMYPGTTDRRRAHPVTTFERVPAEGIDVWLAPAPQRFAISGRVYWPDGVDVENLTIEYGGPDAVRRGTWHVSDPGGLFTIDGVSQETYVLLARGDTARGPLIGLASTHVAVGSVEDVRIMLHTPGAIEGRIVAEGTSMAAPDGLRITPVQMLLRLSPLYPVEAATVDASGRFVLQQLAGEYTLMVDGLPPAWRVRRIIGKGAAGGGDRIVVAAGERVTGIEIVVGIGTT